jgi:hypothetical protein
MYDYQKNQIIQKHKKLFHKLADMGYGVDVVSRFDKYDAILIKTFTSDPTAPLWFRDREHGQVILLEPLNGYSTAHQIQRILQLLQQEDL